MKMDEELVDRLHQHFPDYRGDADIIEYVDGPRIVLRHNDTNEALIVSGCFFVRGVELASLKLDDPNQPPNVAEAGDWKLLPWLAPSDVVPKDSVRVLHEGERVERLWIHVAVRRIKRGKATLELMFASEEGARSTAGVQHVPVGHNMMFGPVRIVATNTPEDKRVDGSTP